MSNKLRSRGADICRNGRPPHSPCYPRGLAGSWRNCSLWPVGPWGWLRKRERERERIDEEGGLGFEPFPFPPEFSKWVCAGWKYALLRAFFRNNTFLKISYLRISSFFQRIKCLHHSNVLLIFDTSAKINKRVR